jgi:hypothetical protein
MSTSMKHTTTNSLNITSCTRMNEPGRHPVTNNSTRLPVYSREINHNFLKKNNSTEGMQFTDLLPPLISNHALLPHCKPLLPLYLTCHKTLSKTFLRSGPRGAVRPLFPWLCQFVNKLSQVEWSIQAGWRSTSGKKWPRLKQ